MDEVRIGIAGLGRRSLQWINLLQKVPGYRITAVYDWIEPLQERALAGITYRGDVKVFSRYEDFLGYSGMDAVGLVVRQKEQGAMTAQALEAGKHVNAEVPAAYTMADCWRIVTAVERMGLGLQPGGADAVLGVRGRLEAPGGRGTPGEGDVCRGAVPGPLRDPAVFSGL
ncbi:MAG: hypothetical protein EXS64_08325 [Candidatus Latescibacteria bacterium]|nr:hypothetical protein [Candidatus Latescibacterota bacterium]